MTTNTLSSSESYDEPADFENGVTTEEARDRLEDTLFSALRSSENTLINAPTALGKSHTVATIPWRDHPDITGGQPVVHFHATTDAREEAIEASRKAGVDCHPLEGRSDACGVARGDYDDELTAPDGSDPSEWFNQKCDGEKVTFGTAHKHLELKKDGLPCQEYGPCPAFNQWWDLTTPGDEPAHDVVHATAPFAQVEELVEEANLLFDERPNYELTVNGSERDRLRQAVSNLLHDLSNGEYAVADLMTAVRHGWETHLSNIRTLLDMEVSSDWLFSYEESHRLAPQIGRAIASATRVSPDRYCGRDGRVCVVFDDTGKLRLVHHQPELEEARCVIGLDAHPSPLRWEADTVDDLEQTEVLSTDERQQWRRQERGLRVVKLGTGRRSHSTGWQSQGEKQKAELLIQWLRRRHGREFRTALCGKSVKSDIHRMMLESGVDGPELITYGSEKSRNDFEGETIGALLGCLDPGDDPVLDWLAFFDLDAKPEMMTTAAGETKRKPGRSFVGPDADAADELLHSIRENHVAQGVGRYARNPDDPDSGATVYVWSDVLPESLTDATLDTSFSWVTDNMEATQEMVRRLGVVTGKEVAEEVGVDKSTALRHLDAMADQGVVTREESAGYQGATEYGYISGRLQPSVTVSG